MAKQKMVDNWKRAEKGAEYLNAEPPGGQQKRSKK